MRYRRKSAARDMTGAIRWVLLDSEDLPVDHTHYPSETVAQSCALPGQRAVPVQVVRRAGAFSDIVRRLPNPE